MLTVRHLKLVSRMKLIQMGENLQLQPLFVFLEDIKIGKCPTCRHGGGCTMLWELCAVSSTCNISHFENKIICVLLIKRVYKYLKPGCRTENLFYFILFSDAYFWLG